MSKVKSIDEIQAGWDEFDRPRDGRKFQHHKGGAYKIVATGFLEESETPAVIYKSEADDTVWVRTAEDFFQSVAVNGEQQPRFKALEE